MMDDKQRAKRILECAREYQKGCAIAGPKTYAEGFGPVDPAECPACLDAFLTAIVYVLESK